MSRFELWPDFLLLTHHASPKDAVPVSCFFVVNVICCELRRKTKNQLKHKVAAQDVFEQCEQDEQDNHDDVQASPELWHNPNLGSRNIYTSATSAM